VNWMFNGLPLHPLLVHAVVVLLPLAAILTVLHAVWPAARKRLGWVTPVVAFVAMVFTVLAKEAGEALEHQVDETPLLEAHTRLGDGLIPWAIGLFVAAVFVWVWWAFVAPKLKLSRGSQVASALVIAIVTVAIAGFSTNAVFQVGESGAKSVWSDAVSVTSASGGNEAKPQESGAASGSSAQQNDGDGD